MSSGSPSQTAGACTSRRERSSPRCSAGLSQVACVPLMFSFSYSLPFSPSLLPPIVHVPGTRLVCRPLTRPVHPWAVSLPPLGPPMGRAHSWFSPRESSGWAPRVGAAPPSQSCAAPGPCIPRQLWSGGAGPDGQGWQSPLGVAPGHSAGEG